MDFIEFRNKLRLPYLRSQWQEILYFTFADQLQVEAKAEEIQVQKGNAKRIRRFAALNLLDGRNVAVVDVLVSKDVQIARNRVALRDIVFNLIDQDRYHGLLVFYYSEDKEQVDFRLSFISRNTEFDENGNLIKTQTHPKRYSYILGSNESCTTAAQRFLHLKNKFPKQQDLTQTKGITLKDLLDAFSVESLNKEFFKKYKEEHYSRFWKFIAAKEEYSKDLIDKEETDEGKQEKPIRDFVKKLLGRIVFLHFLQKKGWMGCSPKSKEWKDGDKQFMQNLFTNFDNQSKFYSNCLTELFYNTLNNNNRTNGLFKYTQTRVPYLNGGLFDDDQPKTNRFNFPVDYFKDLLDFFDQYNFTIDENSPDEQEVGIDPEMLGHIFENLLEENKEKGAFYTPKEIVQYMCQESLIQYLNTKIKGGEQAIENFIRNGDIGNKNDKKNFIVINAKRIEELLDNVKVCDPAIGSGAFPMGILQEIFKAKMALDLTLDRATVKKDIIQNCIYGVDIEKGAVDIARLRFWLALVVDEEEPQPLPNLDFKIMQGNSLLESFEGIDLSKVHTISKTTTVYEPQKDIFGNVVDPQLKLSNVKVLKENDLQKQMHDFFGQTNPVKKAEMRELINNTVHQHIDYNLELWLVSLTRQIGEAPDVNQPGLKAATKKKVQALIDQKEKLEATRKRLHQLQNSEAKPYFLWHLFFKEVFDNGGFDIVIGNPPYIQLQKMDKDADDLEAAGFETFTRTGDIYCLFYEQGNSLLKDNGVLTYITSNKWMNAAYGKGMRKYFLEKTNPILIIDFSKAVVFSAAVVFVNIIVTKKQENKNQLFGVKAQTDFEVTKTKLSSYVKEKWVELRDLNEDNWSVAERLDFDITNTIEGLGVALKDWKNLNFFRGITTGLNEAYHIDEEKKDELISLDKKNGDVIKSLLRGKDIKKYNYTYANKYTLFIPWHFPLTEREDISNASDEAEKEFKKQYPDIYNHLLKFKKELEDRNTSETGIRYEWYAMQRYGSNFWREFEKEKIIWIEISDKANYCLDTKGHYLTNSAYFLTGYDLKYLLAVLNSRLMDFYFYLKTAQIAGGRKRYTKQYVELLPIIQLKDEVIKSKMEIIVDYLIYLNDLTKPQVNPYTENDKLAPVFEDVLNMCVYELYFASHMKEEEIDVLKFIDTEKEFKNISALRNDEDKKAVIGKVYSKLQEQDNIIRNRIISSNIKSRHIIRRINSTTH